MINYKEALPNIKALLFDVDGVLSCSTVGMQADGAPMRTTSIKDGYALQLAVKQGLKVGIISGAHSENIRHRYQYLGVEDIYLRSEFKLVDYEDFKQKHNLTDSEILYMGDDIPDLPVLHRVGMPCCPADAAQEVREVVSYISPYQGGCGCVRDVIEQTLKVQSKWMADNHAYGW